MTWTIEIQWDKTTWVDEAGYVRPRRAALTASYGRDQVTALAPTVTGRGSLLLDNRSKRFSPRYVSSPLYGNLKPARPVRITRTVSTTGGYSDIYSDTYGDTGGVTYTLFRGHTDDQPISPDYDDRSLSLTLVDSLADFRTHNITAPLQRGIRTGQAIGLILDAAGWPSGLRDLDAGATVIPWWWETDTDAMTALEKVVRSEGPPALLTVGTDGEIIFRDRHHRLTRTRSLTSQQTWVVSGSAGIVMNKPFVYEEAWTNIINSAVMSVDRRTPGELAPVWSSDDVITITGGEQKLITVTATDPFYDAQTPEADIDWRPSTGTVTASLFATSGSATTILLTAPTNAVISNLQLRARPLPVGHTVQVSASDVNSKAEYGTRSYPGDVPWAAAGDAQAIAQLAVGLRAEPLAVLTVNFLIANNIANYPLLGLDLGDRVTVVEPETGTNGDFYIESIGHSVADPSGTDHTITFGLEAVPGVVENVFTFDTAGAGFNQGRFGRGLDDPATMFRFDGGAGHRFNEGRFSL